MPAPTEANNNISSAQKWCPISPLAIILYSVGQVATLLFPKGSKAGYDVIDNATRDYRFLAYITCMLVSPTSNGL